MSERLEGSTVAGTSLEGATSEGAMPTFANLTWDQLAGTWDQLVGTWNGL